MEHASLFGMTLRQLARLAAWHESAFGWLPIPDASGAIDVRCAWDKRWNGLPDDSIVLLGIQQPELNFAWALRALTVVSQHRDLRMVRRVAA